MSVSPADVAERLASRPTAFHSGGTREWNALPGILRYLAGAIPAGARTLETGSGASTVVFAAAGSDHTAVSPFPDEHRRILARCEMEGVDASRVAFVAGDSEVVLPGLEPAYDLVFIDGRHSFPTPIADFAHAWRLLRVGGVLVLDDIPIPAVQVAHRFCVLSPEWEVLELVEHRAGAYRKIADADGDDNWRLQPFNTKYPDYSFLSPLKRAPLQAVARAERLRISLGRRYPGMKRWARKGRT